MTEGAASHSLMKAAPDASGQSGYSANEAAHGSGSAFGALPSTAGLKRSSDRNECSCSLVVLKRAISPYEVIRIRARSDVAIGVFQAIDRGWEMQRSLAEWSGRGGGSVARFTASAVGGCRRSSGADIAGSRTARVPDACRLIPSLRIEAGERGSVRARVSYRQPGQEAHKNTTTTHPAHAGGAALQGRQA